jgi:hypothetical protein
MLTSWHHIEWEILKEYQDSDAVNEKWNMSTFLWYLILQYGFLSKAYG